MSNTTVLTLQSADHACPTWCAGESHAESTGSHVSAPVKLPAPEGMTPTVEVPLLSVQIGLGHDEEARGEPPRLWLSSTDGTAELDSTALGSLIKGLDDFALRLRGLQHRYTAVILGGAPESIDHYPEPTHPLELVTPCPPWCQYRDCDEHTPTGLPCEHFHASDEHCIELGLQAVTRTKDGLEPETLDLVMEHMPHAPLPQIDITIGGRKGWHHASLTFDEADELRAKLNEFVAQGREYAQPGAVATLQEVIGYCGVRLIEHDWEDKHFYGHAVGDTRQGGPVWVTVPKDTSGPRLEEHVSHLLAELHERQTEPITLNGEGGSQAGRVPGTTPKWSAQEVA